MNKTLTVTKPKSKNECAKMRNVSNPYEVWQAGEWTWKVLKKYQSQGQESLNPFSRWLCLVTSPFCPNGELGDTYIRDIRDAGAVKVS